MPSELQPLLFWIPFAYFAEAFCGGAFRYADLPNNKAMGWIYRRTWWLGGAVLIVCGFYATARLGLSVPGVLALVGTIVTLALYWRWRPAASARFWLPLRVSKMRAVMGKDDITDGLRWRRAIVMVGQGAILALVLVTA